MSDLLDQLRKTWGSHIARMKREMEDIFENGTATELKAFLSENEMVIVPQVRQAMIIAYEGTP